MKRKIPILIALLLVITAGILTACTPVMSMPNTALTADDAKAIALQHADLTEPQVSRLRAEYEFDDGIPQYHVEFRYNGLEYDYEIHADNGQILSFEKERD